MANEEVSLNFLEGKESINKDDIAGFVNMAPGKYEAVIHEIKAMKNDDGVVSAQIKFKNDEGETFIDFIPMEYDGEPEWAMKKRKTILTQLGLGEIGGTADYKLADILGWRVIIVIEESKKIDEKTGNPYTNVTPWLSYKPVGENAIAVTADEPATSEGEENPFDL